MKIKNMPANKLIRKARAEGRQPTQRELDAARGTRTKKDRRDRAKAFRA